MTALGPRSYQQTGNSLPEIIMVVTGKIEAFKIHYTPGSSDFTIYKHIVVPSMCIVKGNKELSVKKTLTELR